MSRKIDLGESPITQPVDGKRTRQIWYPTINFGDNGKDGEPSFDEKQIGKTMKVTAVIKMTSIGSRSDSPSGKHFDYSFEVLNIEMPDDKK